MNSRSLILVAITTVGSVVASPHLRLERVPLYFEETSPGTFLSQGAGSTLTLDRSGVVIVQANRTIRMRIAGGMPVSPFGEQRLAAPVTRFEGSQVRTSAMYERVHFRELYKGIDLVFYGRDGMLEYDFVVRPGGDPKAIRFELDGAAAGLAADGGLELKSGETSVRWNAPVLYEDPGARAVSGAFEMHGQEIRFACGRYDRSKTLVIDPVLNYVSYLGSTGNEFGFVATDGQGNFYLAGPTTSQDLKVSSGAFQAAFGGMTNARFASDGFVAKFNSSGALMWLTYLGGKGDDYPTAVAADATGNVYVTGFTSSLDFPLKNAAQPKFGGQGGESIGSIGDAFITKLDSTGSTLLYSTYLGGSQDDAGTAMTIDAQGNAYVGGTTLSANFPVTSGVAQSKYGGQGGQAQFPALGDAWYTTGDGFLAKYDPNGKLLWASFIGGILDDAVFAIAIDSSSNVYCGGFTLSYNFPVTANAPQKTFAGSELLNPFWNFGDGFVAKVSADGSTLMYATYLGGTGDDAVRGIAVDAGGQAHVTGFTTSTSFPTTLNALQRGRRGPSFLAYYLDVMFGDAFYTKLSADGSTLLYSTLIGSTQDDLGGAIAVDAAGTVYITGITAGNDFPVTPDAIQSTYTNFSTGTPGYRHNGFLVEFDSSGKETFGTYLGASGNDIFTSLVLDSAGMIYIAGGTTSPDLPVTSPAAQSIYGGRKLNTQYKGDAFVMRLSGAASGGGGTPPPGKGVSSIANAASQAAGTIAAGMMFTASGLGLGSSTAAGSTVSPVGTLGTSAGNTKLLFNGIPAPLLSASATQITGFVPYGVQGAGTAQVVAQVNGTALPALSVPVADAVPGIFTADSTGQGQALCYNSDGSSNSDSSPASAESTVIFYMTGAGALNPPVADGQVIFGSLPALAQTYSVTIGGVNATVLEATPLPFDVVGIIQVVVAVPDGLGSGPQSLYITVGGATSPDGVTISLQ